MSNALGANAAAGPTVQMYHRRACTGNAPGPTSSLSSTRHNARQLVAQQPVSTMGQVDTDSVACRIWQCVKEMSLNLTLMISHGTICQASTAS